MQNSQSDLLAKIERYLRRHDMAPTTFGVEAANDRHLVRRLRSGRSTITLKTADRIRSYMAGGKPRPKQAEISPAA